MLTLTFVDTCLKRAKQMDNVGFWYCDNETDTLMPQLCPAVLMHVHYNLYENSTVVTEKSMNLTLTKRPYSHSKSVSSSTEDTNPRGTHSVLEDSL